MIFSNISSISSTFAVISPEAGARREFYVNTATPLKSDAVRRYEDWFIRNTKKDDNTSYIENSTVVESRPKAVRNLDQPPLSIALRKVSAIALFPVSSCQ